MVEIRIHGRGGQGVVTASDLVAMAAFHEGHHAQAFPSFGSERTGAPVVSYCRVEDREIRSREPVLEPDIIIVQDPTLLTVMDVFSGLKPGGYALINSSKTLEELELEDVLKKTDADHLVTVPASELAREHLGRPLPNAALLGAMSALTGLVDIASVEGAIKQRFHGRLGDSNSAAARAAYDYVKESADAEAN
ncbi:2-oxoacid:acceptor oxidoreductase family protein [Schaalia sp. JY-X159]|jgi:pyruvate ferredoxin oxidoreductase gamma subunit|uniref:2-oxoacid:acceptor oxidoreductase family protein n=1 Tax=Schaalia sp. JY-X159 TaxID=2758575 RepID=UPI00165E6A97|nr:2-oxoacid:acceptor oxidoreductase family protein [Schaalia sp. JY-X159]